MLVTLILGRHSKSQSIWWICGYSDPWCLYTNIFVSKHSRFCANNFLTLFMGTTFDKIVPKYSAQCKSCSLLFTIEFQHKSFWNRKASFALFTLCWQLCTLCKLVGYIDSRQPLHWVAFTITIRPIYWNALFLIWSVQNTN